MTYFDFLAEENFKVKPAGHNGLLMAYQARQAVKSPQDLIAARNQFLQQQGLLEPDPENPGQTKPLLCPAIRHDLNTARQGGKKVLQSFPRYSARLVLEFKLLTPLITPDDDPFYLFANPVRKDPTFGSPYLAAATLKHLSIDAFQRVFSEPLQIELEPKTQKHLTELSHYLGTHNHQNSALRLFGNEHENNNTDSSQAGRLHFSPIWFKQVQFVELDSTTPETAIADHPQPVEAIAANQKGFLEVIYFNPYGSDYSDEQTIRRDLASWLTAIAVWWPMLGLGTRIGGSGAIAIQKAILQAVDWSGMPSDKPEQKQTISQKIAQLVPSYYHEYLDAQGKPITEEALAVKIAPQLAKMAAKIEELEKLWQAASKTKVKKTTKAGLENAKRAKDFYAWQENQKRLKVIKYWQKYGQFLRPPSTEATIVIEELPIYELRKNGPSSWINLARWLTVEQ